MTATPKDKHRQRAAHSKSSSGCRTCKARHLRCDEEKPHCMRCIKAGRECEGYPDKPSSKRFQFKAFKEVTFVQDADVGNDDDDDDDPDDDQEDGDDDDSTARVKVESNPGSRRDLVVHRPLCEFPSDTVYPSYDNMALEFFGRRTIPLLGRFCYPSLWSGPTMHFISSTPVLRQIALAVGSQHRQLTEAGEDIPSTRGNKVMTISTSYYRALRSLRLAISQNTYSATVIVLACLLLVLHDSLGIRMNDFYIHLYNGLRLIREKTDLDKSEIGAELMTTLRRLGLNSLLVNPDQRTFRVLHSTRHLLPEKKDLLTLDQIRTEVDDVGAGGFGFVSKVSFRLYPNDAAARAERDALQARLKLIKTALEAYDAANPSPTGPAAFMRPVIQGRSMLSGIFLQTAMTGYQTSFDAHRPEFVQIVELMRTAIALIRAQFDAPAGPMQLFSLDLGILSTLGYIGGICRDSRIRRECLDLLEQGPSRDGAWDAVSTWWSVWHKMELEERLADNFDADGHAIAVPENCRICSTETVEPCAENGFKRQMVVQTRPTAMSAEVTTHSFLLE